MDTTGLYAVIEGCRSCGSAALESVIDLGSTPLADRLLTKDALREPEPFCPLTVVFCSDCSLLQIRETVDPEILFGSDYPYYSSVSPSLLAHFEASAADVMRRRRLESTSQVVELASNDGYLLRHYLARGIRVLGVDPAPGPARRALEAGIDTRIAFFSLDYAEQLAREGIAADVVHANNVLAHVADTNGFVAGIAILLKEDGEAIIECPYVEDLVSHCEFDTIYHQHLCYFSVASVSALLRRHGLYVNRVEHTPIHGGSLRLFAGKTERPDTSVLDLLAGESRRRLGEARYYVDFGARVLALRDSLRSLLDDIRRDGARIAGYGAAAKACTLMSFVDIDGDDLDYVVDRNAFKHGRYMPGNHLPILPTEHLLRDMPDYLLILSWNFADEVIAQQSGYASAGGRFVVPIPEPRII
jgi:SAM-dependent methyltransferase